MGKNKYSREEIQNELDIYTKIVFDINESFKVYKAFNSFSKEYEDEINSRLFLFVPIINSLYYKILMGLSKLLLEDEKKNLQHFLTICGYNSSIFPTCHNRYYFDEDGKILSRGETISINIKNDLKIIKNGLKSHNATIDKIENIRNNYLAHNDINYFDCVSKLFDENPISMSELEKLIDFICCSLNKILFDLCYTTYFFDRDEASKLVLELFERLKQ